MHPLNWQKSSYSGQASNCLEIAATWQKSSYSSEGNNCIELAPGAHPAPHVHLRESDEPGTALVTSPARLRALLRAAKVGGLDAVSHP
ncbi:DUF397 domain-containing protein [Streptomyces sp. N2-109]|uniref:DUF397 domain-containing protein n=1 Tax=Streptomyces gossypii TaxID=2883101 RepID=A0ABT2JXE2_9ACTN|nr:DUF397 domain-containing protein [Streptomyces gossypii]MCT2592000.1 DUF397 domain-containing protein [Streptomyces gossypii]